ncbi:MAG: WG repeat-containing protein [Bacteroidia bacterium]
MKIKKHIRLGFVASLLLISFLFILNSCGNSSKQNAAETTTVAPEKKEIDWVNIKRVGTPNGNRFFEDNTGAKLFNGATFYNASDFSGNYCVVSKMVNGKELHGVINSKGTIVVGYAYNTIESDYSRSHYFKVGNKTDNKYLFGIVDSIGKLIIPTIYTDIKTVKNSVVKAQTNHSKWGLLSIKNETLVPFVYDYIGSWSDDGLSRISIDKNYKSNYGFIDKTGKVVVQCQYPMATDFQNGIALVQKGKKIGFINAKNETVIDFQFDNYKEIVDVQKNEYSTSGYSESNARFIMEEGYIVLEKNKKWGYIDVKGNKVIPFEYDQIWLPNSIGKVDIEKDGKRGNIDLKTKEITWFK